MRVKSPLLSISSLLLSVARITKFRQGNGQFIVKLRSSRLNIKPYNKLLRELKDY